MQSRFIEFKDNISSFNANRKYGGIIPAAVYRGFDTFTGAANLTFTLGHNATGNIFLNQDLSDSNPTGIWVTRQGGVIMEDATINLSIQTNAGNSSPRIDLVIARHNHDIINQGGLPATYEVVQGATGGPVVPVPSGNDWVIIGQILVAANSAVTSTAVYTRIKVPGLGNKLNALLAEDNRFTAQNQENQAADVTITSADYEVTGRGIISALTGGNSFVVTSGGSNLDLLPDAPNGTKIQLIFNYSVNIRPYLNQLVGGTGGTGTRAGYTAGYRPIVVKDSETTSLSIAARQIVTLVKVSTTHTFSSGDPVYGDYWQVIDVSDVPSRTATLESGLSDANASIADLSAQIATLNTLLSNVNPIGNVRWIYYQGLISTDFDGTGLAKAGSIYLNHAICNSNNGTPNALGRVAAGYDPSNSKFSTIGQLGGEETHTLIKAELPNVQLSIQIPRERYHTQSSGSDSPWGQAGPNTGIDTLFTEPMGSGNSHNNLQPYVTLLPIMRVA